MAFAEEARSVVCPLRRHAAFIVCYTGPNAAASRNGNEQARRHERESASGVGRAESVARLHDRKGSVLLSRDFDPVRRCIGGGAFPLPPPRPPPAAPSPRGPGGGAVSRFGIVALSSRLATKMPGALSVSTLRASSLNGTSPIGRNDRPLVLGSRHPLT